MKNIIFNIKSFFVKEGFDNANKAIQDTAKSAKQAVQPVSQIGNAIGQLEGPVGKGARAVTGFVSAVQSMGVIGGIVAGVQIAIKVASDKIVEHYNNMAKAAKKASDDMRAQLGNQLGDVLGDMERSLKSVGKEADADTQSMKALADATNKVNRALGKREDAGDAAKAAQLQLDKLNALLGIENENVKKVTEAEWDYKIALETGKTVMEERARIEDDAKRAVDQASTANKTASENLIAAKEAQTRAHELVAGLEQAPETSETINALNDARKKAAEADELVARRANELAASATNLNTAKIDLETEVIKSKEAEIKNRIATQEAANQRDEAKREAAENARKEREAEEKAASAAQLKEAIAQQEQANAENIEQANSELNEAKARLRDAQMKQAAWEDEKKSLDKNEFNKIQAANAEKLLEWVESTHSSKALSEKQKEILSEYVRWKNLMQDKNPYDEMVMKFQQQVDIETGALEEQQRIAAENIKRIEERAADGDFNGDQNSNNEDSNNENSNNENSNNTNCNNTDQTYNYYSSQGSEGSTGSNGIDYSSTLSSIESKLSSLTSAVSDTASEINALKDVMKDCLSLC